MLLLLNRLQRERIVAKRILNVPKVRQIRDDLLSARLLALEQFGPQFLALLVVRDRHHVSVAALVPDVIDVRFGHVSQPLVNEAAKFEGSVVFQSVVRGQCRHMLVADLGLE